MSIVEAGSAASPAIQYRHVLAGCTPRPLASYLKALGVLRIVAEQADPLARGFWHEESFVLVTSLDEAALLRFFLEAWQPSPCVSPWNKGSGLLGDDKKGVFPRSSRVERLAFPFCATASRKPRRSRPRWPKPSRLKKPSRRRRPC
jgi:CRISPR-associated protein Csx17